MILVGIFGEKTTLALNLHYHPNLIKVLKLFINQQLSSCFTQSNSIWRAGLRRVNLLLSLKKTSPWLWLRLYLRMLWVWFYDLNSCFKKCKKKKKPRLILFYEVVYLTKKITFHLRERNENEISEVFRDKLFCITDDPLIT